MAGKDQGTIVENNSESQEHIEGDALGSGGEHTDNTIPSPSHKRNLIWRCACNDPKAQWAKFGPPMNKHIKLGRASGDGKEHKVYLFDADTGEMLARSSAEAQSKGLIGKKAAKGGTQSPTGVPRDLDFSHRSPFEVKFVAHTEVLPEFLLLLYNITKDAIEAKIDTETGLHYKYTESPGQWIDSIVRRFYKEHAKELGLNDAIVKAILEGKNAGK